MLKRKVLAIATACIALVLIGCKTEVPKSTASAVSTPVVAVAVPAQAGAVEGKTDNSDAFMWELFTQITAPISPPVHRLSSLKDGHRMPIRSRPIRIGLLVQNR